MDLLKYLDPETLSMAAEVAAVLLLLSLAWRPTKAVEEEVGEEESVDWNAIEKLYVKAVCAAGERLAQLRDDAVGTKLFEEIVLAIPPAFQDRLTGLGNADAMDQILDTWRSVQSASDVSCISMLVLESYEELLCDHGGMAIEEAVRKLNDDLIRYSGKRAFIARYQADRFLALHFGLDESHCLRSQQKLLEQVTASGYFAFRGADVALKCQCAIVGSTLSATAEKLVDKLEQGISDGCQDGTSVVALMDEVWSSKPLEQPPQNESHATLDVAGHASFAPLPSEAVSEVEHPCSDTVSDEAQNSTDDEAVDSQEHSVASLEEENQSANPGTEIEAYATPDDIAALFEQMKSGAGSTSSPALGGIDSSRTSGTNPVAASTSTPSLTETTTAGDSHAETPVEVKSDNDVVTSDDISALFAQVRAQPSSVNSQEKAESKKVDTPTKVTEVSSVAESVAVSLDDIEALFAEAKHGASSVPANKLVAPTAPSPAADVSGTSPHSNSVDEKSNTDTVSADDIAAMFASKPDALKSTPSANAPSVPEPIQLDEAATADDIAALFATIKPAVQARTPASTPVPSAPTTSPPPQDAVAKTDPPSGEKSGPTESTDDLTASVSEDDIASLFASLRK